MCNITQDGAQVPGVAAPGQFGGQYCINWPSAPSGLGGGLQHNLIVKIIVCHGNVTRVQVIVQVIMQVNHSKDSIVLRVQIYLFMVKKLQ